MTQSAGAAVELFIETSVRPGTISLRGRENGLFVRDVELEVPGRRQAASLISVCKDELTALDRSFADVASVATSLGPGSFTGLRVGLTFAKTLAHSLNIPLFGVPTGALLASDALKDLPADTICRVLIDAQQRHFFCQDWASGTGEDDVPAPLAPIRRVALEDAFHNWSGETFAIGECREPAVPPGFSPEDVPLIHPKSSTLGDIVGRCSTADRDRFRLDPITAEPLYVRRSGAEEKADGGS